MMPVNENSPIEDKILGYEASKAVRDWSKFETPVEAIKHYIASCSVAFEERRIEILKMFDDLEAQGLTHEQMNHHPGLVGRSTHMKGLMAVILDLSSMADHFSEGNPLPHLDFEVPDDLA
jgi:hypothetical protein